MLEWSGLPTVNLRAAMFVENPLMTWLALEPLSNGELRLPFGNHQLAPIVGYDVGELCVKILIDPAPHISKSYELNGPELKDMHGFAEDYGAALGRHVTYVPEEVEAWSENYVDSALAEFPHTAEHIKALARLMGGGGIPRHHRPAGSTGEGLADRGPPGALAGKPRRHARIERAMRFCRRTSSGQHLMGHEFADATILGIPLGHERGDPLAVVHFSSESAETIASTREHS